MPAPIPFTEYRARVKSLLEKMGPDTAAILYAAPSAYRSRDTEYAYRQDSDFYYLTGFNESHAVLVLLPQTETPVVLFNQTRKAEEEIWSGARIGQEAAVKEYGVDAAFAIDEIATRMPKLLAQKKIIYYPINQVRDQDLEVLKWINQMQTATRGATPDLMPLSKLTAPMRLIKSPAEIELMRHAATLSAQAHNIAMEKVHAGQFEYQLAAEYLYHYNVNDARDVAYLPIVAGGKNACVLHYTANTDVLRDGDLVLVDAGCEYQNYCADVSRTFPVNGRFTPEQAEIYQLVLDAYRAGLKQIHPGSTMIKVQNAAIEVLTQGLVELKLLQGKVSDLIAHTAYKKFFMHGVGHWLGLDVHDVGAYKINNEPVTFKAGMVLTLEPGIYISESVEIDKKWWHIGVRIEDDILVTPKGHEVLSSAAPISLEDIEQLMR